MVIKTPERELADLRAKLAVHGINNIEETAQELKNLREGNTYLFYARMGQMTEAELYIVRRRATEHLVRAQLETLRNAGESYPDLCIRNPGAVIETLRRLT